MTFEDFFEYWNKNNRSLLKKHRLIAPLKSNKLLQQRFKKAISDGLNHEILTTALDEICHFLQTDDFWRTRIKKQGIPWFFQERKSDGSPNWCWFYEHRMDRLENEAEQKAIHDQAFNFNKSEELP